MLRGLMLIAALLLGGTAGAAEVDALVAAERAFAAHAQQHGFRNANLAFVASDGIAFRPHPGDARAALEARPPDPPGPSPVVWWPVWAGIARSGDLGFTTGPFTVAGDKGFGHYFTVWKRQADGGWKWIYDGGPTSGERSRFGPGAPVSHLAPSTAASGSAEAALREVAAVEAPMAPRLEADAPAAYRAVLADDAWLMGGGSQAAAGRDAHAAELAARPASLTGVRHQGGEASAAGDLVFTYGEAHWRVGAAPAWGHYVRIWQKRTEGWKLVYDALIPVRERGG